MKKYLILLLIPIIAACSNTKNKANQKQNSQNQTKVGVENKQESVKKEEKKLPPLVESELTVSEEDFGDIIELQGTSHPVDKIFMVKECEMIASDNVLIVKNYNNSEMFMAFSLPDFKFLKSFGKNGKGPGEFQFPSLVKDESGKYLCYIYDRVGNRVYSLAKNFEIKELPIAFEKGKKYYDDKQLYGLSSNDFLYVQSIKRGKAIFHSTAKPDSVNTTLLKKLAFSDKHKNWAAYIGDFGVNGKKNRSVFAYKYFKRLIFFDYKNKTSKVVSFDSQEKTKKGDPLTIMSPSTTTHYWGMSSNDKYVYALYSGRNPIEVTKEVNKSSGYIYVEQFDWNGNLVHKFKLDHWGYFCVNEKENKIYLASTTDEHPFISYDLPND